ncbi:MAG: AtpZ/AtpI family protein [Calditrichaeota bacterium]|nr:MAG: AtpZ/AtpI family protein [Calditrichota bacterium]
MRRPDIPEPDREDRTASFRHAAPYLSIGYVFLGSMVFFAFIGYKLDTYFNSGGLILLAAILLALGLSFYRMVLVFKQMHKKDE